VVSTGRRFFSPRRPTEGDHVLDGLISAVLFFVALCQAQQHCRKPSLACGGRLICGLLKASGLDLKRVGDVSLGLASVIVDQFLKHR
jgi:hypothetical protein